MFLYVCTHKKNKILCVQFYTEALSFFQWYHAIYRVFRTKKIVEKYESNKTFFETIIKL